MKRITRRQVRAWLAPMRRCFAEMKTGEVDAIRGYAVTRLNSADDYARIDFCCAGFRGLLARLCPSMDVTPIERIERKLAAGVMLSQAEIDEVLALLNRCEDELLGHSIQAVKSAVLDEQIAIEFDQIREQLPEAA